MRSVCIVAVLLFGFYTHTVHAQIPNWQWFQGASGKGQQEGWDVAVDKAKNVYVIGTSDTFQVTFGNIPIHFTGNATINGGIMSYIVKYSPTGDLIWVKSKMNVTMTGIAIDKNDNIFIDGIIDSAQSENIYLAKFDTSGNEIWQNNSICTNNNTNTVATDNEGNIYVGGCFFTDSMTIGSFTLVNPYYANAPSYVSSFLAKYDPSGNPIWVKPISASSLGLVQENALAIDNNNNIYVGGYLSGDSISVGGILLSAPTATSGSFFLARYDTSGNVIWANASNGDSYDVIVDITTDGMGNIYVTGSFSSDSLSFGSYTLYNPVPQGFGSPFNNFFAAKYRPNGEALWAKGAISPATTGGGCITSDYYGDVYITGGYNYSIQFDSIFISDTLSPEPMFIVSYDSSGNIICAGGLPGGGDDQCGICADPYGNVYLAGDYEEDTFAVGTDTLFLTGTENVFSAKFNCGITLTSINTLNPTPPITVYPNPSGGVFYFSGVESGSTIEVYDLLGQEITSPNPFQRRGLDSQYIVDLSGKPVGVYFYRVTDSNNTSHQGKIVVE